MVGGPLAQKLGIGAGIGDLIGRRSGEMVGGDVPHAIARGLNGVHFHIRQCAKDRGHVGQHRPVELDVLPGGEVAIALVIRVGDVGKLAHLVRRNRAIRNGDPQHVGVQLQIQPVHQAQGAKFFFGQAAIKPTVHLLGELGDTGAHKGFVEVRVGIHWRAFLQGRSG